MLLAFLAWLWFWAGFLHTLFYGLMCFDVARLGFRSTAQARCYQLRCMLPLVMLIKPSCARIPSCLVRLKVYLKQSAQDLS